MTEAYPEGCERVTFIYALVDPRTDQVRYIGKSNSPQQRLAFHLFERDSDKYGKNPHKINWLRALKCAGLVPRVVILDCVSLANWQEHEIRWIAQYRAAGASLVNATDGGEGGFEAAAIASAAARTGKPLPEETRNKIRERHKGRVFTEETRAKMSAAQRGREGRPLTPKQKEAFLAGSRRPRSEEAKEHYRLEQQRRREAKGIVSPVIVDCVCAHCGMGFQRRSKKLTGKPVFCRLECCYEFRRARRVGVSAVGGADAVGGP